MIRRIVASVWMPVPVMVLSALIHTTDAAVGGARGLVSLSVLTSVVIYGLAVAAIAFVCLLAFIHQGMFGFSLAAGLFACLGGALLTGAGSTATTFAGLATSFVGVAVLVFLTLSVAVLPAAALGWPKVAGRRASGRP